MRLLFLFFLSMMMACTSKNKIVGNAQNQPFQEQIYADKFGNIYHLNAQFEVICFDIKGKEKYKYANTLVGNITHLDVTNPQRILAYVSSFNTVIILDNTLAELNIINLNSYNLFDVSALATSNDGNFWVYDEVNWRLIKIRENGEIVTESNRLSDYNLSQFMPLYMIERDNQVLMSTSENQLLVFDNFGKYQKSIPLSGIGKFSVHQEEIIYLVSNTVMRFNLKYLTEVAEMTDGTHTIDKLDMVRFRGQNIFLSKGGEIIR